MTSVREWRDVIDKSTWERGPWDDEPDKVQWRDEKTALPCLIVRGPPGALCGYVGVYPDHPWHRIEYSDCTLPRAKPRGEREGDEKKHHVEGPYYQKHIKGKLVCEEEWCSHTPGYLLEDVHGGLTFSDGCIPPEDGDHSRGICHIAEPGEREVWWFGFDCNHSCDVGPANEARWLERGIGNHRNYGASYKRIGYVKREIESLARQLAEVAR